MLHCDTAPIATAQGTDAHGEDRTGACRNLSGSLWLEERTPRIGIEDDPISGAQRMSRGIQGDAFAFKNK